MQPTPIARLFSGLFSGRFASHLAIAAALFACATCTTDAIDSNAATTGLTGGADAGAVADSGAPLDTGPVSPFAAEPRARIFLRDPVSDNEQLTEVTLVPPTTADGSLVSASVAVLNCLNEEGGPPMRRYGMTVGSLCHETRIVLPDDDGHYLGTTPPADWSDQGDGFAEVQMYHHVNRIHDYFKDEHGLTDLDYPLEALVNVSFNVQVGPQKGWQGFPNAAFIPKEGFAQLGLPDREHGAIVFGQYGKTDFCYDASVIYHEYTHAMIGTTRLQGSYPDQYGLDNLSGAMNEGFADYFAASMSDLPVIGSYALTFAGDQALRDLTKPRYCPDDLTTEVHADGKIIGSAMWAIRSALGPGQADAIILRALQSFTQTTNLDQAGKLILAEAESEGVELAAKIEPILVKHGIIGCVRAKEYKDFNAFTSEDQVPYSVEGQGSLGMKLPDGVPGYVQFWVDLPPKTAGIALRWRATTQGGWGGGAPAKLHVAVRRDKPVDFLLFAGGIVEADLKVQPAADPKSSTDQKLTLGGACLPKVGGRVYLMFLNTSDPAVQITHMFVDQLPDLTKADNVEICD